jgi:hypothetical protein
MRIPKRFGKTYTTGSPNEVIVNFALQLRHSLVSVAKAYSSRHPHSSKVNVAGALPLRVKPEGAMRENA